MLQSMLASSAGPASASQGQTFMWGMASNRFHWPRPFSGKAHRLGDEPSSWALTFASNLELARSSRRRSREEAKRTYHWTFSGRMVKETKTGTSSYAQGRTAGEKRKKEIESCLDQKVS